MAPTSAEGEALDSTAAKVRPELGVERVAVPGSFIEMMQGCTVSAVHLEMRDTYTPKDPDYLRWQAGEHVDPARRWPEWIELVSGAVARGVVVRRARIVSEPVTDYIRYEHGLTDRLNIGSGELVRWLPRRRASDLSLPGNDFWVFDDRLVLFNHFAGDGSSGDKELREEPAVITLCASAFEAELRLDAGLTARALAADAGWDRTKVSQIEHARRPPAPQDVRIWCRICGAEGRQPTWWSRYGRLKACGSSGVGWSALGCAARRKPFARCSSGPGCSVLIPRGWSRA